MTTRSRFLAAGTAAAATAFPGRVRAATPTVNVGFIDSFSGPFADIGPRHRAGVELALKEANAAGRIRYRLVQGDDKSSPSAGVTEGRRLLDQEKVDVLLFGSVSAVSLALSPITLPAGVFQLDINPNDTSITGKNASKNTYRFAPTVRMIVPALSQRLLATGKKFYFLVVDFAFGHDAYARMSEAIVRAGGTEVGKDLFPPGTHEYSPIMTKIASSGAEVVFICGGGFDVVNICKSFVDFGLQKKMRISAINIEDTYADVLPIDQLAGSTFGIIWAPTISESAKRMAAKIRRAIPGPLTYRYYMGYIVASQLIDRMNAVGTTKCDALVAAFANHRFDAAKETPGEWRGCDHQCRQDTLAARMLDRKAFAKTGYPFQVEAVVPGAAALGSCDEPDARLAQAAFAKQTIGDRDAISLR